jgi:DNA-binding transcriptional LysR family regulator
MELGSVEAIKRLVEAGLGFGILPAMAVADARSIANLLMGSLAPRLSRKLALALRRDKLMDKGLREVVKALTAIAPSTVRGEAMPAPVRPAPFDRSME